MTIGIATILGDTAILVADGRETWLKGKDISQDDLNKIVRLGPTLAAMSSGVSIVGHYALKIARTDLNNKKFNIKELCDLIDRYLRIAWKKKIRELPKETDFDDPKIYAAILLIGVVDEKAFFAGFDHKYNDNLPHSIVTQSPEFFVAHREKIKAEDFFQAQLEDEMADSTSLDGLAERNNRVIKSSAKTIKFVEDLDSQVGGTIYYAIVQSNKYQEGIYKDE